MKKSDLDPIGRCFNLNGLVVYLVQPETLIPILGDSMQDAYVNGSRIVRVGDGRIRAAHDLIDHAPRSGVLLLNRRGFGNTGLVRIAKETSGRYDHLLVLRQDPKDKKKRHHTGYEIGIGDFQAPAWATAFFPSNQVP